MDENRIFNVASPLLATAVMRDASQCWNSSGVTIFLDHRIEGGHCHFK